MIKPLTFTTFAVYELKGVDRIVACLDAQGAIQTLQQTHEARQGGTVLGYVDQVNQLVCVSDLYPFPTHQDKTIAMLEVAARIATVLKSYLLSLAARGNQ